MKLKLFSKTVFVVIFCDLWFCCSHLRLELLFLCWQLNFLAFDNFGNIEVEEVTVKNSLDGAGADRDEIVESFVVVSVHPVEQMGSKLQKQAKTKSKFGKSMGFFLYFLRSIFINNLL